MGYLIQYDPQWNKKYKIKRIFKLDKRIIFGGAGALILLLMAVITPIREWLWELIIPGDASVTTSAFTDMVKQVKSGESVSEAFTAFCKEILIHA